MKRPHDSTAAPTNQAVHDERTRSILHLVDRDTGGVPEAVATFIRNSPARFRHEVVVLDSSGFDDVWRSLGITPVSISGGTLSRLRQIRATVRDLKPAMVHAHSSFPGVYARIALRNRHVPIVYSPHCFAFERKDLPRAARVVVRWIERVLARNTSTIAACSRAEQELTHRVLGPSVKATWIPNVASIGPSTAPRGEGAPLTVVMSGRASAQKDPAYFAALVSRLRAVDPSVRATWAGSGTAEYEQILTDQGISVTGWLAKNELTSLLRNARVYVHSAAWEGFPIAVLDAHAARLPILVRSIAAFSDLPREVTVEGGLDALLASLATIEELAAWRERNLALWDALLEHNTNEHQARALAQVWSGT